MSKRINIVLPDKTVAVLDRVAAKCSRSRFIDQAVRHFVGTQGTQTLLEELKTGYRAKCRARSRDCGRVVPARRRSVAHLRDHPRAKEKQNQTHMTFPKRGDSTSSSLIQLAGMRSKRRARRS